MRSKPNNFYYCHNPERIRVIIRLGLGLSHLHKRKFKQSFQDYLNPRCLCGNDNETSTHYQTNCLTYTNER